MHPILESLVSTPHAWIRDLLYAFNAGDIAKFDSLAPALGQEVCFCSSDRSTWAPR